MKKMIPYCIIITCLFFMVYCGKKQNDQRKENETEKIGESQPDVEFTPVDPVVLINAVKIENTPYEVGDDLLQVDTLEAFSGKELRTMGLMKLSAYRDHYKFIPIASFKLHDDYHTILVLQYYLEESFAWLINYSLSGEYLYALEVYYDCAEGMMWVGSTVYKNKIVVEEGCIYENEGKPTHSSYKIAGDGSFVKQ